MSCHWPLHNESHFRRATREVVLVGRQRRETDGRRDGHGEGTDGRTDTGGDRRTQGHERSSWSDASKGRQTDAGTDTVRGQTDARTPAGTDGRRDSRVVLVGTDTGRETDGRRDGHGEGRHTRTRQ